MTDELIAEIQDIGVAGEGVGIADGLRVFIDGALPGERVRVRVTERKKNYARGEVVEWLVRSPQRVEPPCPYFGRCGGCQLMHLSADGQLEIKRRRVESCLQRIGGFAVSVESCIASPRPLAYRNKIQLPVGSDGAIGLYARNSHDLIPIDRCQIHCDLGEAIYQRARKLPISGVRHLLIRSSDRLRQALVIIVTDDKAVGLRKFAQELMKVCPEVRGVVENVNRRDDNVILGETWRTLAGVDWMEERFGSKIFRLSAGAFLQVNPEQAERLYAYAIERAQLSGAERVLDAYCGVGTLALLAADHCREVIGIESFQQAVDQARDNANLNGVQHARFETGKAEELVAKAGSFDVAFLNPPRKGCEKALLDALEVRRIVYVSCDPATLARDARILADRGYRLESAQPFDMFPQTVHVETVAVLIR